MIANKVVCLIAQGALDRRHRLAIEELGGFIILEHSFIFSYGVLDMIAVDSVCHSENLIEATFGFLLRLLMNANCRGGGNAASSLRDSFVMSALIRGRFARPVKRWESGGSNLSQVS